VKDQLDYELRCVVIGEAMAMLGPHWSKSMTPFEFRNYLQAYIARREPELKKAKKHDPD